MPNRVGVPQIVLVIPPRRTGSPPSIRRGALDRGGLGCAQPRWRSSNIIGDFITYAAGQTLVGYSLFSRAPATDPNIALNRTDFCIRIIISMICMEICLKARPYAFKYSCPEQITERL